MKIDKTNFSNYITQFNFRELFNEMGLNNDRTQQPIVVDDITFMLQAVAEKSGFKILICSPTENGIIPDYITRKKIETKVTKLFQEHLIIFYDANNQEQIWQLAVRQSGKPTKITETRYHISQSPELLYQRASGIFFEMDEEEKITIVDVKGRMAENFHANAEKVTKQFYDKFKKEHTSFLAFIKGINEKVNKEWYASLMLNRLMFCYFIQKKGFLDNNKNYLREKLKACQVKKGKNKFYSFYRDFLLVLFHQGLNEARQSEEVKTEIGRIPYLNGGLFDEHELEKMYASIDIEDSAFERIFDFFDQYEWHLDTRILASGKDINPDVIGYIFEKYINDRAQMGAYYTKEDITEYISKNCIIPYLFDETNRQYPKAFSADGEIWDRAKQSGNEYLYDALKFGIKPDKVFDDLPDDIAKGLDPDQTDLVEIRKSWNRVAPPDIALPTEIYREVIDRRKRYVELREKIDKGEMTHINDFITYNLNIRQFAQDIIENTSDPDFLRHFYKAINSVTIIDPTCGSGAFLFAAMNILEPLYEACIRRMRAFVEDEDRMNVVEKKSFSNKYKYFSKVLEEIQSKHHPNLQYFIYKSIILRNLYGVDIMNEAVEIAKLRLFLKLVATVDVDYRKPNLGLEPLPDIDFNIRAGNTLVGFATEKELEKSLIEDMMGAMVKNELEEKCDIVARTYARYKEIQLGSGDDYHEFKVAKDDLTQRLKELNHELNLLLHKQSSGLKYDAWLQSHQPFHWFAEFYEIIHDKGGFDCVIGNPPYLEFKQISYKLNQFKSSESSAVHAVCIERAIQIKNINGSIGMIVPLSIVSTQRMQIVQEMIESNASTYYANFSWRPAKLFDTVNRALTIFISLSCGNIRTYTNTYFKWTSETRTDILERLQFINIETNRTEFWIPKIENKIEKHILRKIKSKKKLVVHFTGKTVNKIYYRSDGGLYWKVFTDFAPAFVVNEIKGSSTRETNISLLNKAHIHPLIATLSSNTFWWWYSITSNCRHLNPYDVNSFPIEELILKDKRVYSLGKLYVDDLIKNSSMLKRIQKQTGEIQTQSFKISLSKPIIDEIDMLLAEHYGFTAEELDFIINYDIKYRMGKELGNGVDE